MSKGPGTVQREILVELQAAHGSLPWEELRRRFPRQAEDHSLHRAVRSLKRMGYIQERKLRGRRWIALCAPGFWSEAELELLRLVNTTHRMLRTLAAARGVKLPAIEPLAAHLDTYRQKRR
jgi:hypothetical protein